MSSSVFGTTYSSLYDTLYKTKPYEKECDFLEILFNRKSGKVKTILDLGCGTGGHIIQLLKRGYEVTGIDRSESMLEEAQKKIKQEGLSAELIKGDICSVVLHRRFDAIISMFSVIGYLAENKQVAAFCQSARNHVNSGGIVVFDAWNGSAVLSDPPLQKVKVLSNGTQQIIRITEPELNTVLQTVNTRFNITVIEHDRVISREDELHKVRYFFPQELTYYCDCAGFKKVEFCPFLRPDDKLSQKDWYLTAVCQLE